MSLHVDVQRLIRLYATGYMLEVATNHDGMDLCCLSYREEHQKETEGTNIVIEWEVVRELVPALQSLLDLRETPPSQEGRG